MTGMIGNSAITPPPVVTGNRIAAEALCWRSGVLGYLRQTRRDISHDRPTADVMIAARAIRLGEVLRASLRPSPSGPFFALVFFAPLCIIRVAPIAESNTAGEAMVFGHHFPARPIIPAELKLYQANDPILLFTRKLTPLGTHDQSPFPG